jgi:uncharacterized protein YbjT (DUF2867 family)
MGADSRAVFFYNRVKGDLEEALLQLGYPTVKIFRPSLLLGHRMESRIGELIAQSVMGTLGFLFLGPLLKYRPVPAVTVAKSMITGALNGERGNHVYPNEVLFRMGK